MGIKVTLAVVMAQRNVKSKDLAEYVGITESNLSLLKQGRVKGVRFETLAKICEVLDCRPGDLLDVADDDDADTGNVTPFPARAARR